MPNIRAKSDFFLTVLPTLSAHLPKIESSLSNYATTKLIMAHRIGIDESDEPSREILYRSESR